MHATDFGFILLCTFGGAVCLSFVVVGGWWVAFVVDCWRQKKNQKQADEAIHTLETALRTRPRVLADSRLPNRRARVRAYTEGI